MNANSATATAEKLEPIGMYQPTSDVLQIARLMEGLGVVGTPRNYELFFSAVNGQPKELGDDIVALGQEPHQSDLDMLYAQYIMRSRLEAVVEGAPQKVHATLSQAMDLIKREHKSLASYQQILNETSRSLREDEQHSEEVFGRFLDIIANATSATMDHGRSVLRAMEAKTAELEQVKSKLDEYRTLADKDSLTGLWNRRAFDRLCLAIRGGAGKNGAFLILDIDHFKQLNDSHGHPFGDAVLRRLADVLQENLRQGTLVFRAGGEEFAIFLENSPGDASVSVAERLRAAVAAADFSDESVGLRPGDVTISVGVCFLDAVADGKELYVKADKALYDSKKNGRNRVTVFGELSPNQETADAESSREPAKRKDWYLYRE